MLAGISVDYYLRLEQGRDEHPSSQVLDALPARWDWISKEWPKLLLPHPPLSTSRSTSPARHRNSHLRRRHRHSHLRHRHPSLPPAVPGMIPRPSSRRSSR
jgi:hypothetical protein